MNDEIKEILDRLDYNEWEVDLYKVPITWCELYDIRDYITNLQEENERLTRSVVSYDETLLKRNNEYEDYKSRCEKAIELINAWLDGLNNDDIIILLNELENTLKGTTHCFDEEEHKKLQQENERLKEENEDYKSRIDKAIEYIKDSGITFLNLANQRCFCNNNCADKIINILNGGDEE